MPDDIYEHDASESSTGMTVKLQMLNLRLHSSGVFSNVYRGTLLQPEPRREIAVKKTWPDPTVGHKNLEYLMLQALSREKHKNIVQVLFTYQNVAADKRICESMIFDFMPATLSSLIKRLGPPNADLIDIKLYTWQLFNGLYYLMKRKICHRDIKPQNLLVDDAAGILKIGDFGSAKVIRTETRSTPYQVTRFYRPPELLMGAQEYGPHVDVWSGGCVMGEMLRGKVLLPGCDSQQQLTLIVRALGVPDAETLDVMKVVLEASPITLPTECLPSVPKEYVRFLQRILTYRPRERLCGPDLLLDPFFQDLFTPTAKRSNAQLISTIIAPADVEVIRNPPPKKRGNENRSVSNSKTKEDNTSKSMQAMPETTKLTQPAQGTPPIALAVAAAAQTKPKAVQQKKTKKAKASRDQNTMSRESTTTTEDQLTTASNAGGSRESVEPQANAAKANKPAALKTKP
ncbi:CMGC/GSK protein kinase [Aphelenchoides avenae]|nr:CMGC/GSK protein kinase [Aphelenchus avenae]